MKYYKLWALSALFSFNLFADLDSLVDLGNGACWVSFNKENLKIASFNEHWSISDSSEAITDQLATLINAKNYFSKPIIFKNSTLGIHCGGYGSSFVARFESDTGEFCVWAKPNGKTFDIRSFGSLDNKSKNINDLCDGRKWGELILGTSDAAVLTELSNTKWSKYIEQVNLITVDTYKITLKSEYYLKEELVKKMLQADYNKGQIRYIEFNEYRHPIGEFYNLK